MIVREYAQGNDYRVEARLSADDGDFCRILERNSNPKDTPVFIGYNLGKDFKLRTKEEQKRRVLGLIKMLHMGVREVLVHMEQLSGVKAPDSPLPHEMGTVGGREPI